MVKIKNVPPTGRSTRRPGRFLATRTKGGNFVAKAWPRKRGPAKQDQQKAVNEQFALAQRAANEAFSWFWIEADNMAQGSIWNRRELLVKAAQGNLYEIYMADGEFYGNWFVLAKEIQALLDTVSDETGVVLLRTAEKWVALMPGAATYVLTSNGPGFPPSYQPGAVIPDTYQWSAVQPLSAQTSGNCTKGVKLKPSVKVEVNQVNFTCTTAVGVTYLLTIAKMLSTDRIDTILQQFDITAAVFAASGSPNIPLPAVQVLEKGQLYGVFVTANNGNTAYAFPIFTSRAEQLPIPTELATVIYRSSVFTPAVNDLQSTSVGALCFNMAWREIP